MANREQYQQMKFGKRIPLPIDETATAVYRWLHKPVHKSRLLDAGEQLDRWEHQGLGELVLTEERSLDGRHAVRLSSATISDKSYQTEAPGRSYGKAQAFLKFAGEDWTEMNRISFWVYPTLPGFRKIVLEVTLHNEGESISPDKYKREGINYVMLRPDEWNQIVWEIEHLPRERVTGLELAYRLQGSDVGAATTVAFDFNRVELQLVDPDHNEGWQVAPGQIAFSHSGYELHALKQAMVSGVSADSFELVDAAKGETVFTAPVIHRDTATGSFQILDFTQFAEPGTYALRVGEITSRAFAISATPWADSIWKSINFFYCERCGTEVPGVHGVCHRDWLGTHGDHSMVINGGWHDAGDLSQGLVNTAEAVYAMLALAQHVQSADAELYERLLEEAQWGLDWMLRTRFGDGYRMVWATMDLWTDGIFGTADDEQSEARNDPFSNFTAAASQALAYTMFGPHDRILADYCLRTAVQDWGFALEQVKEWDVLLASAAVQAAVELFKASGEQAYLDKAVELVRFVMDCQQVELPEWEVPLNGFFYKRPGSGQFVHYHHRGHDQAPILALGALCELLPQHEDWGRWYAAIGLYTDFVKQTAAYMAPYWILPNSIYSLDETDNPDYQEQIRAGVRLSDKFYLRRFPIWGDFRGNLGVVLSNAKAISYAARLHGDGSLYELAQKQLEWTVGANPFAQSLMYGEGYDYAPQYTAMSGDIVGSLPVGIQTKRNTDAPYWPVQNCYNYKEVWVHPSSRWLWLMCDMYGTGSVTGTAPGGSGTLEVRELRTGKLYSTEVQADGSFELRLPYGKYAFGAAPVVQEVFPGGAYAIDLM